MPKSNLCLSPKWDGETRQSFMLIEHYTYIKHTLRTFVAQKNDGIVYIVNPKKNVIQNDG